MTNDVQPREIAIEVKLAQPLGREEPIYLAIYGTKAVGKEGWPIERALAYYRAEGQTIVDALVRTLPGGTIDAVLIALLEHRRGILQVPHDPVRSSRTEEVASRVGEVLVNSIPLLRDKLVEEMPQATKDRILETLNQPPIVDPDSAP